MSDSSIPICVDLDGTLTPTDTLHESILSVARSSIRSMLAMPSWLTGGKAAFKREIAQRAQLDVATLPIRQDLLEWLREEKAQGRKLVLTTAADSSIAEALAQQLGIFSEVVASDGQQNLSGENKRRALVERYGEKRFDYVGNSRVDEPVWRSARQAIVVGEEGIVRRARAVTEVGRVFEPKHGSLAVWLRAIRLHQWVKNVLVFLPAMLAHKILEPEVFLDAVVAFIAFGCCASSVYLINDLLDLSADRVHPRKRNRPFAAGLLSARDGVVAAILLIGLGALLAASVNIYFCGALAIYYVFTWAYSLRLKRAAIVDVLTLAGLYTLRIVAGGAATLIEPSFWLLAFSIFLFLSLGIVKRYTELDDARQVGKAKAHGRGYSSDDLPLLMALGVASAFCSVLVVALYINSPDSQMLYKHSKPLWLICPLLLYWISRVWLLTARGQMQDDPVVFALRDRLSLLALAGVGLVVLIAL